MKKLAMLLLLALTPIRAQTIPATANLTASDAGTCATANACLVVNVSNNAAASVIQLTGTFSATLQFEGVTQQGGTFVSVAATPLAGGSAVTSSTGTGAWRVTASGLSQLRVRCSTFVSGTVAAAITLSTGSSGTGASGAASGVTSVTGSSPIASSGGTTPAISCPTCFSTGTPPTLDQIGNPAGQKTFALGANTPAGFSAPGVFTNTTPGVNGPNVQASVNSCSPSTEWLNQGRGGTADTEAITGCVTIGSGSTATQATGVAGYANVSSTSTNGVGGYFQAVCTATGVKCWGLNAVVESVTGHAATFMQHEFDVNVNNAGDVGVGMELTGVWAAQPATSTATKGSFPAYAVEGTNSTNKWTAGFACDVGTTENGSNNGNCIDIAPLSNAAGGKNSQAITFHTRNIAGNANISAQLVQGDDGSDKLDLIYVPTATNFGTFVALLPVHGSASGLSPLNLISSGTVAISSSTTGTTNFTQSYASAPICTVTPTSDPTATGVYWVTPGTSGITVTVKVSGTITFDYHCIPAAN